MKILLATDGSEYSKVAVEEVANRKFPPGTEVRIVSIFEGNWLTLPGQAALGAARGAYSEIDALAQKLAEEAVKIASENIKEKNATLLLTTKVFNASPKQAILTEAEAFEADLIVVGSQGKGALSRFFLGSVSHAVALHALCSVEIVRKRVLTDDME